MKILITQIYCFAAIGLTKIIKNNKRINAEVYATDSQSIGLASGSLLVDHFFQICSPTDETQYIQLLTNIIKSHNIDILISVDEKELITLLKNKDSLNTKIISTTINNVELFNNKYRSSLEMKNLGLQIPEILTDIRNQGKIIFRKNISVGSKGIYIVDLEKDMYIENHFNNDYFIQKYIEGNEYTVDVFADNNGNPKLIIPRKRIEIRNGLSFKCQLIQQQILIDNTKKIANHFKIPGLYNIQFIVFQDEAYFIELNPRFSGSGIASILASFDYIELFLNHFLYNENLNEYEYYMSKVAWNSIITRYYEESIYHPD